MNHDLTPPLLLLLDNDNNEASIAYDALLTRSLPASQWAVLNVSVISIYS
jgi:hypothetical protein